MAFAGGGGDTSALKAATRREEDEARRLEARNEARVRNIRARRSGRRALLAFSDRSGGGDAPQQQTTLG
jgi:hypothetical protein